MKYILRIENGKRVLYCILKYRKFDGWTENASAAKSGSLELCRNIAALLAKPWKPTIIPADDDEFLLEVFLSM